MKTMKKIIAKAAGRGINFATLNPRLSERAAQGLGIYARQDREAGVKVLASILLLIREADSERYDRIVKGEYDEGNPMEWALTTMVTLSLANQKILIIDNPMTKILLPQKAYQTLWGEAVTLDRRARHLLSNVPSAFEGFFGQPEGEPMPAEPPQPPQPPFVSPTFAEA